MTEIQGFPEKQGLYDPKNEHDACGIGFVVQIKNKKSHEIVRQGLEILINLNHRGAVGADPTAGDGSGILIQIPDAFLRAEAGSLGISLPKQGAYGIGMLFLPRDLSMRRRCEEIVEQIVATEEQVVLGWRDVPVDSAMLGPSVRAVEPVIRQVFVGRGARTRSQDAFERKLFVIRKCISRAVTALGPSAKDFYIPSMSSQTSCL